jgi:hypothetical protein
VVHQPGDEHDETNETEEPTTWSSPTPPPEQPTPDFPSAAAPPPPVAPPPPPTPLAAQPADTAPEPRKRRRLPLLIGTAILGLVIIGGAAFAAARLWSSPSVNPAERLPGDMVFYADVNLDPGRGQTTQLRNLLDKFDALDDATDVDAVLTDVLDQLDLNGIEPDDLKGWLGTRAAFGVWLDAANQDITIALALASRNDNAAQDALADILEASDEEFGYVVDDGLAVLAYTPEGDPQDRAEELVADGRATPLADDANFQADLEWLADDQLAIMWINMAEMATMGDEIMAESPMPNTFDLEELYGIYDMESAVVGVHATDAALEVRFRADGEAGTMPDQSDWLDRMGGLRSSEVAAILSVPDDLNEFTQPVVDALDGMFNAPLPGLDEYVRNQWDYELALTDEEFGEHAALVAQWESGRLEEDGNDFDRLVELDDRLWAHGIRSEYDAWIAAGNTEEEWRYEYSLTRDEYLEFLELETSFDELEGEALDRFYELDSRLYSFGVVSDHEPAEEQIDVGALVEEIYDLLSGARFTVALSDLFGEPEVGVSATLANGPADRILDLPIPELDVLEDLGDELVFDGDTVTFGEVTGMDETLAEHPRFDEAFAGMPDEASMALFVDVQALNSSAPDPEEWLEPVSVISMVQDTTGSGMVRILID